MRPILFRLLTILACGALLAAGFIYYAPLFVLPTSIIRGCALGLMYLGSFGVLALVLFRDAGRDIVTLLGRIRRRV